MRSLMPRRWARSGARSVIGVAARSSAHSSSFEAEVPTDGAVEGRAAVLDTGE